MNIDKEKDIKHFIERTTAGQFMGHITQVVDDKLRKHFAKYHKNPKYIKMPIWCFKELERATKIWNDKIIIKEDNTEPYFMGMRICETETIEEMNEIEVF